MSYDKLRIANPKLFFDGIDKGFIPSSAHIGEIAIGQAASSPMIEGVMGGPHAPESYTFDPYVGIPIGANAAYPKPWRSAAQKIQDDVYGAFIGPFAKMVGITDCSQNGTIGCTNDTCSKNGPINQSFLASVPEIYGRLGILLDGGYVGEVEFRPQNWYHQDQGTRDGPWWSNYFDPPITGDQQWLTKKDWWAAATKTVISVWYGTIKVDVEVATGTLSFDDDEHFPGEDLSAYNDYSLDLLFVMVSVAAATRWIL